MPNIGSLLKDEIARLSRREVRRQVGPLRKMATSYRHDIASLKRRLADADRRLATLARQQAKGAGAAVAAVEQDGKPIRFVAKGLRSLRKRLGLSANELAKLIGVSSQSVYNWEMKRAVPRKEQLAALVALRNVGKREARKRLEGTEPEPAPKRQRQRRRSSKAKE